MRRVAGWALVVLGAALLGIALLARSYLPDRLVVTPLDQSTETVATGQGRWLDGDTGREQSGDLVARRRVIADVPASSEDVAVWNVGVVLETGTGGNLVRASQDRVALDRRTGEAVNCCNESVGGDTVRHSGISYKFPFGTEKRDYSFWDVNSRKSYPAKYVTEEEVQGLTTYKFVQQVPGQQLVQNDVPFWYEATRTVWIEPRTGVIVKGSEQNSATFRDDAGQVRSTIVQFDVTFDDATQRSQADLARDGIGKIRMISLWLPLAALLLGLLLLAAAVLLLRRPRGPGRHGAEREDTPEPVGTTP